MGNSFSPRFSHEAPEALINRHNVALNQQIAINMHHKPLEMCHQVQLSFVILPDIYSTSRPALITEQSRQSGSPNDPLLFALVKLFDERWLDGNAAC